jgi:predicted DNA-binding transcriptional regulator AlpA
MEKLLTAQQVADGLGWHVKTLYRKCRNNEIALNVVRLGSREIAFRTADVEQFVRDRVVIRTGSAKPQAKKRKDAGVGEARKSGRESVVVLGGGYQSPFMSDGEARRFFRSIR